MTEEPAKTSARDVGLGKKTAEGLATMTPMARQTAAAERDLGGEALFVADLTKRFGRVTAVDKLSYTVPQGSFSAIVGPNGAGKTTALSMISGLLPPSHGSVELFGLDVWRNRSKAQDRIGILPDRVRMFEQLTGAQYLSYVGAVRRVDKEAIIARSEQLLDAFDLRSEANRLVVDYSSGLRKKLALASALIHAPDLLVLDEPFESIDPVSAGTLIEVLNDFVSRGGTVLLSSHSMDLVQRVCDHVAVIMKGELLAEGTVDEVRGDVSLEERFRDLVRGPAVSEGLDWLNISFG
ncbi:ABC transporter ATP-binding protein [Gulosibacter bifidus]|uniref:ATP-binding cassette domain-containing protein n=1 Tax=Gulosibacter bifidus TaxID=272239 RepID=A0ABW5RGE5_9MICO|nr:ABC transporter ATP-binding protein [Gulosibacter bifidus]